MEPLHLRTNQKTFKKILFAIICFVLILPCGSFADIAEDKALILYYSRTGKSETVSKALQKLLDADIIEIKDLKDREGLWGFIGAAVDSYYDRYTPIEPAHPDLSPYTYIILASPVWNWKISAPIRTLIHRNSFGGKKLVAFTTANIDIKKYAHYGDEAPFVKRFLRDYLNSKSKEMRDLVAESGADIAGHYHIATQEKTPEQIEAETLQLIYKSLW